MKTTRRLISMLLTMALVLSCLPGITLLASAAEIEKPQGISIVQDFDVVKGEGWTKALNLPETVKVDGVDTAVVWEDAAKYVDAGVVGYYSVPGDAAGNAVSITVQVREKVNLLLNGDFSEDPTDTWDGGWSRERIEYPAGSGNMVWRVRRVMPNVNYSQAIWANDSHQAALTEALVAGGIREYGMTIDAISVAYKEYPANEGTKFYIDMRYWYDAAASSAGAINTSAYNISTEEWTTIGGAFEFPGDWKKARFDLKGVADEEIHAAVLLDNAAVFAIDVLPLEEEPTAITEVNVDLPALGVVVGYKNYVADWKVGLALPTEADVATADGAAKAQIIWDYSTLNLDKVGKYVVTGKVVSATYGNPENLTVEQLIYVREKENLVPNGDLESGKNSEWQYSWSTTSVNETDTNKVFLLKRPIGGKLFGSTQSIAFFTRDSDYTSVIGKKISENGLGQYALSISGKSVAVDEEGEGNDIIARADLTIRFYLYDLVGKTNIAKLDMPINAEDWTTSVKVFDINSEYERLRPSIYMSTPKDENPTTIGAASYLDNIELIPLRVKLTTLPKEIVSAEAAETAPKMIIAGLDKYVADWQATLELPTAATITGSDGATVEGTIKWDYAPLGDLTKAGQYTIKGYAAAEGYSNYAEVVAAEQVIYILDDEDLITNGDFNDGLTGWSGSWTRKAVEHPAEPGNYVFWTYKTSASNGSQFLFQTDDEKVATAERLLAFGLGKYLVSFDAMSAASDDTHPAREDQGLNFVVRYWKPGAASSSVASGSSVTIETLSTTEWTNVTAQVTVTNEWTSMMYEFKSKVANVDGNPMAYYVDNLKMIPLCVTLTNLPAEIESVQTETKPIQIVAGYDKYVGENWKTELGLITEATVAGTDGKTATASIVWDYAPLGDLTVAGKYTIKGALSCDAYYNFKDVAVEQTIVIVEKTNLVGNGYFDENVADWGTWNRPVLTENNTMFVHTAKVTISGGGSQAAWINDVVAMGERVAASGAGQYYVGADAMAAPYDEETPAREDMVAWLDLRYKIDPEATSTSSVGGTARMPLNATGWTKISTIFDIANAGEWIEGRIDFKAKATDADLPGAIYLDNVEMILLKADYVEHVCTPAEPVKENEVAATCAAAGSYDLVTYCSGCGEELSRETKTVEALPHTPGEAQIEKEVACTCGKGGSYDKAVYCTVCNAELSRETITTEPTGEHTAAEAAKENEVAATCTTAGSYDEVVKCSVCGAELSRKNVTVDALGHTYDNDQDADCNVCGEIREVTPTVPTDANLVFFGAPGLSFQDYIGMQIMLRNKTVSGYDSFYVEITQVDFEGNVTTTQTTGTPYGSSYTFFEQQILSWSMTEKVTMTLYAVKGEVVYKGASFTTSVEELALSKIPDYVKTGDMARAKALVDMLNFGSAVQTAYDHNATDLPNAELGDLAQYGTTGDPEFTAVNDITGTNTIKVYSNNISMQSKVEFQFMVKATDLEGKTVVAKMGDTDATVAYEPMGSFTIIRVACGAAYMRENFTIVVNDANGNAVTSTYNVTVEAYAAAQLGGEKAPAMLALIRYGDAVAAIG